jgi:alkaline phosphatase
MMYRIFNIAIVLFINISVFGQSPKNIILIIGDGMGFNHLKACNNFYGTTPNYQEWDTYRVSTYSKEGFYNSDSAYEDFNFIRKRYTDSGAAGTAIGTGYKTHNGVIGLNENYYVVENLTEYAESKGLSTGVVTTVPFCHATPAGFIAHVPNRSLYHQIASQMLIDSKVDVIIGCGHPFYDDDGKRRDKPAYKYISESLYADITGSSGLLTDHEGIKKPVQSSDADNTPDVWTFVSSKSDFRFLSEGKNIPKRLFGMPEVFSTIQQSRSGKEFNQTVPDLSTMSLAALNVLAQNKKGFFLMIEGGAIDWASHDSSFVGVVEETGDLNMAVETVIKWVEKHSNWKETLVIITADHETGFLTGTHVSQDGYDKLSEKNYSFFEINNTVNDSISFQFLQGSKYSKCDHTNSLVPMFVKGAGSGEYLKKLSKYKKKGLNYDRLSGMYYLDNTDIPKILFDLIKERDKD